MYFALFAGFCEIALNQRRVESFIFTRLHRTSFDKVVFKRVVLVDDGFHILKGESNGISWR